MDDDSIGKSTLPFIQKTGGYIGQRGVGVIWAVGEGDPYHLGDGARVCRPRPKVESSCVLLARRSPLKALHGALPADDALRDVGEPGVHREAVEA